MQAMIKKYKEAEKSLEKQTKGILEFIKGNEGTFQQRMTLALVAENMLLREEYFTGSEVDVSPYDDLRMDRNESSDLSDIYDMARDSFCDVLGEGEVFKRGNFTKWVQSSDHPRAKTLKYMVDCGIGRITYDW